MAFNVAYYDLLGKNIRHIYSSLPSNVRFRCDPDPGVTLHPHDGCLTPSNKRRTAPRVMHPSLYRRLWTYSTEFGCPVSSVRDPGQGPNHRQQSQSNDTDSTPTPMPQ